MTAADSTSEPPQPSRLEKKTNTPLPRYPRRSLRNPARGRRRRRQSPAVPSCGSAVRYITASGLMRIGPCVCSVSVA